MLLLKQILGYDGVIKLLSAQNSFSFRSSLTMIFKMKFLILFFLEINGFAEQKGFIITQVFHYHACKQSDGWESLLKAYAVIKAT